MSNSSLKEPEGSAPDTSSVIEGTDAVPSPEPATELPPDALQLDADPDEPATAAVQGSERAHYDEVHQLLFGDDPELLETARNIEERAAETMRKQADRESADLETQKTADLRQAEQEAASEHNRNVTGDLWPPYLPTVEEVAGLLTNPEADVGVHEGATRDLLGNLSSTEATALFGGEGVDLEPLRTGILVRWRLSATLRTPRATGAPLASKTVNQLLKEVDHVLDNLETPEHCAPDVANAFASTRAALARDAVTLTEVAAKVAKEAAQHSAKKRADDKYKSIKSKVVETQGTEAGKAQKRREVRVIVATALMVVVGLSFHGYQFSKEKFVDTGVVTEVSFGEVLSEDPELMVIKGKNSRSAKAEVEAFKADQERANRHVHEVKPGEYIVLTLPQGEGALK